MKTGIQLPSWLFLVLWLAALLIPFGVGAFSWIAGVLAGVGLPILWLAQMPSACQSGGFIAFPLAIVQLAAGLGWLVLGIRSIA